jgi:hypothetical protein
LDRVTATDCGSGASLDLCLHNLRSRPQSVAVTRSKCCVVPVYHSRCPTRKHTRALTSIRRRSMLYVAYTVHTPHSLSTHHARTSYSSCARTPSSTVLCCRVRCVRSGHPATRVRRATRCPVGVHVGAGACSGRTRVTSKVAGPPPGRHGRAPAALHTPQAGPCLPPTG